MISASGGGCRRAVVAWGHERDDRRFRGERRPPLRKEPDMTVLADDLLLVLLDPASGKPGVEGTKLDYGLGGALLLELALAERIDVVGPKPAIAGGGRKPAKAEVVVLDDTPPDDDLLADALRRIAEKRRKADSLVPALAKGVRSRLLERAEQRGEVRHERLTLRPDRWPEADGARRRALTTRLSDVL